MTTWTRGEWRERPGQFALIVMFVTILAASGAHLVGGGLLPGPHGCSILLIGAALLGFLTYCAPGGVARLLLVLAAGQGLGHLAFARDARHVSAASTQARTSVGLHAHAPPCALHDLSNLTLPASHGGHGPSLMLAAHSVAILVAALLARSMSDLVRRGRLWCWAIARRLRNRLLHTVRYARLIGYSSPIRSATDHRTTPLRGPPVTV